MSLHFTVALKSKLPLSDQLWLISRHSILVKDPTDVLLEGFKKVWVWISGPCSAILYIHLLVHVWHWNPTLEQQSASFQQHNMPDQMSLATKSPAKRKSPVTLILLWWDYTITLCRIRNIIKRKLCVWYGRDTIQGL